MKEATGELNMTIITVIAIAAIGIFLWMFLPGILENIQDNWDSGDCTPAEVEAGTCN
ncbi:MAG: hypothetical protein PHQ89_02620 [Bacilli bacterium]|nr:hypothetical protein [Bacilli bacterium]